MNNMTVIFIWVDDLIIAASDALLMCDTKSMLKETFKMKDLGKLSHFLGIDFAQRNNFVKMNQKRYLCKVLERFQMYDCKPRATPSDQKLECSGEEFVSRLRCSTFFQFLIIDTLYRGASIDADLSSMFRKRL